MPFAGIAPPLCTAILPDSSISALSTISATPGYATPVDYAEATRWFRAAAEQGLAPAQDSLAHCYLKGVGLPADYAQAARWARLAAEQGNPRAFALLGYLYETGKGLPLDYVSAYAWYSRASS